MPGVSTFPEFNLRTYVKHGGKAGVLFLTLEAQSRITCAYAPRANVAGAEWAEAAGAA